jgi:hypothetical protein
VAWYASANPNGAGPWVKRNVTVVDYCHNLQAADFDLDGDVDLMVGGMIQSQHRGLKLMLNNGTGTSWSPSVIQSDGSYSAELGDIDKDGDLDIVGIRNWNSGPTYIYRNTSAGGSDITRPTITSVTTSNANTVRVLFSEPVATASAQTVGNYSINNSVTVSSAVLGADTRTVTLTTSTLGGGNYTLTVNNVTDRATPPNSIVANSQIAFSFTSGDNTYEQWRQVYFTSAELSDPAVSGETCDPDGDRISNLMEYALGLNPRVADVQGRPTTKIENGFLVLTCTRNKEAADVVLDAEAAISLAGPWSAAGLTQQVISDNGVIQTIKFIDSVAVGVEQSRFLRLTVQFR